MVLENYKSDEHPSLSIRGYGYLLHINFLSSIDIHDNKPDRWGRGERSSVLKSHSALFLDLKKSKDKIEAYLVTKATHASSNGLLLHNQATQEKTCG